MEITGSSIAGYSFGLPSLISGLVGGLLGLLFLVSGTGGGVSLLLFGGVLLLAGLVATPFTRRIISSRLGINFSRGAIVGVSVLSTVVATILFVVAIIGLLSSGSPVAPGEDVSNVAMTAQDADLGGTPYQLEIDWNSRAQSGVDPDTGDFSSYSAENGEKFIVVRMEVTNTGTEEIELTPRFFQVDTNGVKHDYQGLFGSSNGFSRVTLSPGATHEGWMVFTVDENATSGVLLSNQDAYYDKTVKVTFTHQKDMPIDMAD